MTKDITRIQEEIGLLAREVERSLGKVRLLGEGLDEPVTEVQALGLEPEPLPGHVAERLLTADDTPFEELPGVLRRLEGLRQEELDEAWRRDFPLAVTSETGRHALLLNNAAEDAVDRLTAVNAGVQPDFRAVLTAFYDRLAFHSAEINALQERCRRYLAELPTPTSPEPQRRKHDA